jgi:hypothetical protein
MQACGHNQILSRMMNIEQGISNFEVSSQKSSLLHSAFYIRYSAVRFLTSTQVTEKLDTKGLKPPARSVLKRKGQVSDEKKPCLLSAPPEAHHAVFMPSHGKNPLLFES